jgi:hypothetical protein
VTEGGQCKASFLQDIVPFASQELLHLPVCDTMANPLAAFGQALGIAPQTQSSHITDAVLSDDPIAVARFLSQGANVNAPNDVRSSLDTAPRMHSTPPSKLYANQAQFFKRTRVGVVFWFGCALCRKISQIRCEPDSFIFVR